ncbi:hypothetical protein DRQ15_11055 [candidate division KSB1 bacterium]|nr:MAG: hypothetical protein DRQ00_09835 [candidate division KSB1 bacterium]RKY78258.1 MAG: hypothetical protein DRQ12_06455 [candidate division KSB1 bacterium]RKY85139.1 MAG: hypothetical protein DRQ11_10415 [candidate division KSB1 bacterium]RKY87304.1 MAG: hypothetical protein DRQ15_11055 [candidate division KSB1 bacterium]
MTSIMEFKEFLEKRIYPKYGPQPKRFKNWNKRALRDVYVEFFKPHYTHLCNNPEFRKYLQEIEHNLFEAS